MITPNPTPWDPGIWQHELKQAYRESTPLLESLGLAGLAHTHPRQFGLLVPRSYAARMRHGDPNDPLLKQILPTEQESTQQLGFVEDPLGERNPAVNKAPGLIQKYHGRALMITTPACAIHCRYCFRRHFPYEEHRPQLVDQALHHLQQDASIEEVILSGGDPLVMGDTQLDALLQRLNSFPHVKRIRLHSRLPVVLPERATDALMRAISTSRASIIMVIHCNHPAELNHETARALACWQSAGATLLNQSVLLNQVNNNVECLVNLSSKLFDQGVLPYYLHLPDRVAGTHHFFVNLTQAQAIYQDLQNQLPGYLVPKLVQELPEMAAKQTVSAG